MLAAIAGVPPTRHRFPEVIPPGGAGSGWRQAEKRPLDVPEVSAPTVPPATQPAKPTNAGIVYTRIISSIVAKDHLVEGGPVFVFKRPGKLSTVANLEDANEKLFKLSFAAGDSAETMLSQLPLTFDGIVASTPSDLNQQVNDYMHDVDVTQELLVVVGGVARLVTNIYGDPNAGEFVYLGFVYNGTHLQLVPFSHEHMIGKVKHPGIGNMDNLKAAIRVGRVIDTKASPSNITNHVAKRRRPALPGHPGHPRLAKPPHALSVALSGRILLEAEVKQLRGVLPTPETPEQVAAFEAAREALEAARRQLALQKQQQEEREAQERARAQAARGKAAKEAAEAAAEAARGKAAEAAAAVVAAAAEKAAKEAAEAEAKAAAEAAAEAARVKAAADAEEKIERFVAQVAQDRREADQRVAKQAGTVQKAIAAEAERRRQAAKEAIVGNRSEATRRQARNLLAAMHAEEWNKLFVINTSDLQGTLDTVDAITKIRAILSGDNDDGVFLKMLVEQRETEGGLKVEFVNAFAGIVSQKGPLELDFNDPNVYEAMKNPVFFKLQWERVKVQEAKSKLSSFATTMLQKVKSWANGRVINWSEVPNLKDSAIALTEAYVRRIEEVLATSRRDVFSGETDALTIQQYALEEQRYAFLKQQYDLRLWLAALEYIFNHLKAYGIPVYGPVNWDIDFRNLQNELKTASSVNTLVSVRIAQLALSIRGKIKQVELLVFSKRIPLDEALPPFPKNFPVNPNEADDSIFEDLELTERALDEFAEMITLTDNLRKWGWTEDDETVAVFLNAANNTFHSGGEKPLQVSVFLSRLKLFEKLLELKYRVTKLLASYGVYNAPESDSPSTALESTDRASELPETERISPVIAWMRGLYNQTMQAIKSPDIDTSRERSLASDLSLLNLLLNRYPDKLAAYVNDTDELKLITLSSLVVEKLDVLVFSRRMYEGERDGLNALRVMRRKQLPMLFSYVEAIEATDIFEGYWLWEEWMEQGEEGREEDEGEEEEERDEGVYSAI